MNNGFHTYCANFSNFICTKLQKGISSAPATVRTLGGNVGRVARSAPQGGSLPGFSKALYAHSERRLFPLSGPESRSTAVQEPAWAEPRGVRLTLPTSPGTGSEVDVGWLGCEADSPFALDSYRVGEDVCEICLFYSQAVVFFFFLLCLFWIGALLPF